MANRRIAVIFLMATLLGMPHAGVVHVDPRAAHGGDGSRGHPLRSVRQALDRDGHALARRMTSGDSLVITLAPGAVVRERIVVGPESGPAPNTPIVITGNAANPSTISPPAAALGKGAAGRSAGVSVYNRGNVTIENQTVQGSGMDSNSDAGISCYADNGQQRRVTIRNCDVYGWGAEGITIGGWGGADYGFRDVLVENCRAHDNKKCGITVWGEYVTANENVTIRGCRAYNNLGDPDASTHTGSGIVLGGVTGALVEYCIAYNNGERCTTTGGPIGIWAWFASDATIQYCEAYDNHAVNCDGGGFDLDGGCQRCVIQYCYSHDNDGAGYLICQYDGARAFTDNIVRYNISQNDGRRNGFSGIHFWSSGSNGGVQNTKIYGNTVYTGISPAVRFQNTSGQSGTKLWNNLFITAHGTKLVDGSPSISTAQFQGNAYWASGGDFSVAGYRSLDSWRSARGQETLDGRSVGYAGNPMVTAAGGGGTIDDAAQLTTLSAYMLREGSPLIGAGIDLISRFGIAMGEHDYYGNAIPRNGSYDIGAHEYEVTTFVKGHAGGGPDVPSVSMTPVTLYDIAGRAQGQRELSGAVRPLVRRAHRPHLTAYPRGRSQ